MMTLSIIPDDLSGGTVIPKKSPPSEGGKVIALSGKAYDYKANRISISDASESFCSIQGISSSDDGSLPYELITNLKVLKNVSKPTMSLMKITLERHNSNHTQ